ncbi:60S ribosomal protein L31 [Podila epicladia]|nr:60S ribosomal protein L31 [Podila epicladia]KAG0094843.1 60S ribosomal protein L31 [Podila epicladia]
MAPLTQAEKRLKRRARKKKRDKRAQKANLLGFQAADTIECTYHIHKFIRGRTKRKYVPHAIRAIKMFIYFKMGTKMVKLDPEVNKKVWKKGRKTIQEHIRLRFSRRVETRDGPNKGKKYTYVDHVLVESFYGLQDVVIKDAEDSVEAENAVSEDVSEMVEDAEMDAQDDAEMEAQEDSNLEDKPNNPSPKKKEGPKLDVQESSKVQVYARIVQEGAPTGSNDTPMDILEDCTKVDSGTKPMVDSGDQPEKGAVPGNVGWRLSGIRGEYISHSLHSSYL